MRRSRCERPGAARLVRAEAAARRAEGDAKEQVGKARAAEARESNTARDLRRNLANSNILLAQSMFDKNLVSHARELLDSIPTEPEQLRGFEWHYLKLPSSREGIFTIYGHTGPVMSVAFSPDGTRLATSSSDGARLWDAHTGVPLVELKGQTNGVTSVAFSPDGARLATGSGNNTVRLWDARTGEPLLELANTQTAGLTFVTSVAFSPDGTRLAIGNNDKTARLWDARTGVPLLELKGHTDSVTSVAFSPDGTRLVTGSYDETARLWDARAGAALLELKGHTDGVTSVAFSPDGTRLATSSEDKTGAAVGCTYRRPPARTQGTYKLCDERGVQPGRHTSGHR